MTKFRKVLAMFIAAIMAMACMSVGAFADNYTMENNGIDYSVYDEDLVYIQADADRVAEYNANLKKRASFSADGIMSANSSYSEWNWNISDVYSTTSGSVSAITIPYYFVPVTNALWFNVGVTNISKVPSLSVNLLNDDGSLSYVGSYNITSVGNNNYEWSNYKRSLSKGKKYVFMLASSTNWSSAYIDISNSSL